MIFDAAITVKIETKATLNVALCRLLSCYSIKLALDPRFYDRFPQKKEDFDGDRIENQRLEGRIGGVIKRLKTASLHLIMDRTDRVDIGPQEFQNPLEDGRNLEYKNIWKLDDNCFVVKGLLFTQPANNVITFSKEHISGSLLLLSLTPSLSSPQKKSRSLRQRVVGWVKGT